MLFRSDKTFFDINHSNIFLDQSIKAKERKAEINKWDLIKIKNFCTAKETINKTKRQHTECEKIFANDVMDKGLTSKIHKQCIQLSIKKQTTQYKNWAEDLNRHFSKEDIQIYTDTDIQAHEKMLDITNY